MGTLYCGATSVALADDELALFELVAVTMSARGDGFLACFASSASEREHAIWVAPTAHLRFAYDIPTSLSDVDDWHLDLLMACANSDDGVLVHAT